MSTQYCYKINFWQRLTPTSVGYITKILKHLYTIFKWYISVYVAIQTHVLTRYSYAVGVYATVVVCRLSVTHVLWLNGAR